MLIMTLDCSGTYCLVGIIEVKNNKEKSILFKRKKAKVFLASNINLLVKNYFFTNKKLMSKIKLIAVNIGPGSYTGIRASVSFAKGIAIALKIPVYGINLMDTLHFIALKEKKDANILSICKYKKKCFLYRLTNRKTAYPIKNKIEDFEIESILNSKQIYENKNLIIIGDNAKLISNNLKKRLTQCFEIKVINRSYELSNSIVLAKIALLKKISGLNVSSDPFYVKSSDYF